MSNKWNDSVDALKARIAEALASPEPPSAQQASDIGELLERINTYHQELEFQNDELTRIRQDLEDSRFRYQDLYYNGPIAYVTCNQDLEILTLNREFSLMTGIETFSRKGDPLTKYIHPDSQDIFHFHVRALLGGPGPQTCQLVLRGEERDIPVRLESNLLSNGDGYLIRSAVIDQTAEQAAEATANRLTQELKASNERLALQNTQLETYRRQLEATMLAGNIAWWEMDVKSGAVRFNEQKARLIGRNPAEFVHYTDFTTLVHPADLEPMMENMRRYLRGESVAYAVDYRIRHLTGSWKWFQDIGVASTVDANGLPLSPDRGSHRHYLPENHRVGSGRAHQGIAESLCHHPHHRGSRQRHTRPAAPDRCHHPAGFPVSRADLGAHRLGWPGLHHPQLV